MLSISFEISSHILSYLLDVFMEMIDVFGNFFHIFTEFSYIFADFFDLLRVLIDGHLNENSEIDGFK